LGQVAENATHNKAKFRPAVSQTAPKWKLHPTIHLKTGTHFPVGQTSNRSQHFASKVIAAINVCTFSNDTHPFRILSSSS
jgi:hypothetical protein